MQDLTIVENWVDAATVAKHLGFKADHIRVLARNGKIPAQPMQNGSRQYWRFKISQVDAFMSNQLNISKVA